MARDDMVETSPGRCKGKSEDHAIPPSTDEDHNTMDYVATTSNDHYAKVRIDEKAQNFHQSRM